MGAVKEMLLDLTEKVMDILDIDDDDDDCKNFEAVETWLMEHVDYADVVLRASPQLIAEEFRRANMCPQCQTIGKPCHCLALERV
jgi:hypothetical protein